MGNFSYYLFTTSHFCYSPPATRFSRCFWMLQMDVSFRLNQTDFGCKCVSHINHIISNYIISYFKGCRVTHLFLWSTHELVSRHPIPETDGRYGGGTMECILYSDAHRCLWFGLLTSVAGWLTFGLQREIWKMLCAAVWLLFFRRFSRRQFWCFFEFPLFHHHCQCFFMSQSWSLKPPKYPEL